jgi:hypothetical protein
MIAMQEVTEWKSLGFQPNFIYLIDDNCIHAYINSDGDQIFFKKPLKFSKSFRKFKKLSVNPFDLNAIL